MSKPTSPKLELKETLNRTQFLQLLQRWQQAIEQAEDFHVEVSGSHHTIPNHALDHGRYRVEYEVKDGEYKFELTLKWR